MNYYAMEFCGERLSHVFDSREGRDAWVAECPLFRSALSSKDSELRRVLRQEKAEWNNLLYYHYKDEETHE